MLDNGLNYQDIAEHFDCNKGTIFNMVKRDRAKKFMHPMKVAQKVLKTTMLIPLQLTSKQLQRPKALNFTIKNYLKMYPA